MPTTSPRMFSSGPPELPGLIAASVWIMFCGRPSSPPTRPAEGRDDAHGDGVAQVERVADRHHPVAGLHLVGIAELGFLQRRGRHLGQLNERAVGQRVAADDLGRVEMLVRIRHVGAEEADLDLVGVLDDVIVGEDEARLVDDEAGAGALSLSGASSSRGAASPRGLRPAADPAHRRSAGRALRRPRTPSARARVRELACGC